MHESLHLIQNGRRRRENNYTSDDSSLWLKITGMFLVLMGIHPWKLTWRITVELWSRWCSFINGWFLGSKAVNFPGCRLIFTFQGVKIHPPSSANWTGMDILKGHRNRRCHLGGEVIPCSDSDISGGSLGCLFQEGAFEKRICCFQEIGPTGPTERTPQPEHLIALATYLGVRW